MPAGIPTHGLSASPMTASSSSRAVRLASIRSSAAMPSARAMTSTAARRSGSRRTSASSPRSTAPEAMSRASSWGVVSYSRSAAANGRTTPPASRSGRPAHVPVDDLGGERPAGPVEAGDPEHPERGPLLAAGRADPGPGTPGTGEHLRQLDEPVDGAEVAGTAHARRPAARRRSSVRSTGRPGTMLPARPSTVSPTNSKSTTASSTLSTVAAKTWSR